MKTEELFANTATMMPANASENCLAVGTRLGDFQITGILGEGGFGIVYKAFDESLQRTVAIKEYMPGTLSGRGADGAVQVRAERHKEAFDAGLKSFINEARLLAQFDHPSLVKVYRFWEQNRTAYMVMRYYDGQTLKDIVRERPDIVTEAWLKFIFKQILEALDTLYKAKVLHRDVSPDNIIVQKNGDAVLLDFGSARQIIGDMTQGLTVILKPGYAPVEQYSDDATMAQGPWTDIYALAAVMYFAIAKNPPVTSVARMIKDSLVMLQDGTHVGFSYKFLVAIDKGLALQPEDRPQTMDEFRRLLGIPAFASSRTSRSSRASKSATDVHGSKTDHTGPKTQSRSRRIEPSPMDRDLPKPVLYGLAGVALIALVGGWFYLKGSNAPEAATQASAGVTASTSAAASSTASSASVKPPLASVAVAGLTPVPTQPVPATPVPDKVGSNVAASAAASVASASSGAPASAPPATVAVASAPLPASASSAQTAASAANASAASNAASAQAEEAPAYMMNVKLTVKPWGEVRVDGKKIGVSPPMKRFQLPEGKHQIRISNSAYPDFTRDLEVVKSNRKRAEQIEVDFTAGQK